MFAPRYFGERYFAPRYYPPASNIQGGAGSIQPGGFRIGFFQDRVRFRSELPEASFEIDEFEVKPTSRDFQLEIDRFNLIIQLLESRRMLIQSSIDLSEFQRQSELDHIDMMTKRLIEGEMFLKKVKKRRLDEEAIISIIAIDD